MSCDVGEMIESSFWFSRLSITSPTSQLILQAFSHFTFITAHSDSPRFLSLHLSHSLFSNPSLALPTSQLILQPFPHFTYVTAHSPTLPSLYLCHSSFSNPSLALPMSQLILQPFHCFTQVTAHSSTLFPSPTSQALHLFHLASRPCLPLLLCSALSVGRHLLLTFWITYSTYRTKRINTNTIT